MVQIKQCFLELTKQTLWRWLKDDCSGDYKKLLQAIVGRDWELSWWKRRHYLLVFSSLLRCCYSHILYIALPTLWTEQSKLFWWIALGKWYFLGHCVSHTLWGVLAISSHMYLRSQIHLWAIGRYFILINLYIVLFCIVNDDQSTRVVWKCVAIKGHSQNLPTSMVFPRL